MYEYEYIEIETGGGFWINNAEGTHRDVIDQEAREGWRYVGYVPLTFSNYGGIKSIDLIFERKIPEGR